MKVETSLTGIILAGGKSRRMKCEKAFLKLGAKTIIEELLSKLEKRFPRLMIIADQPEKYIKYGTVTSHSVNRERNRGIDIEVFSDIIPEKGPLGGIYTGLVKSQSLYNFVFACDMPLVNLDLIDYMLDRRAGADIVVPRWQGKFEPLHAIYSKHCIEPIKIQLEGNDLKIINFFSQLDIRVIKQEEIAKFNHSGKLFLNINTQQEYSAVAKMSR